LVFHPFPASQLCGAPLRSPVLKGQQPAPRCCSDRHYVPTLAAWSLRRAELPNGRSRDFHLSWSECSRISARPPFFVHPTPSLPQAGREGASTISGGSSGRLTPRAERPQRYARGVMSDYQKEVDLLAPLESFDYQAFVGSAEIPQSVCDLVLSLALAYNDLRDSLFVRLLLDEVLPSGASISPARGQFSGLIIARIRLQVGRVYELLKLVEKCKVEVQHPYFRKVLKQLSKPGRESWSALETVAQATAVKDKTNEKPLIRALRYVRNRVAFHYDPEHIRKGFELAFADPNTDREPLLSRGGSLQRTRFYFADAAAAAFIREKDTDQEVTQFLNGHGELVNDINRALYEVVTKFIASRGFGWRSPA